MIEYNRSTQNWIDVRLFFHSMRSYSCTHWVDWVQISELIVFFDLSAFSSPFLNNMLDLRRTDKNSFGAWTQSFVCAFCPADGIRTESHY